MVKWAIWINTPLRNTSQYKLKLIATYNNRQDAIAHAERLAPVKKGKPNDILLQRLGNDGKQNRTYSLEAAKRLLVS